MSETSLPPLIHAIIGFVGVAALGKHLPRGDIIE